MLDRNTNYLTTACNVFDNCFDDQKMALDLWIYFIIGANIESNI